MSTALTTLRIALAQMNSRVGDIQGNLAAIKRLYLRACQDNVDILVFPELALIGYAPEDLVLRTTFQNAAMQAIHELVTFTGVNPSVSTAIIVGSLFVEDGECYNAALMIQHGKILGKTFKHVLPNYGVFDEKRLFTAGSLPEPIPFHNCRLGLLICEDMWHNDVPAHYADKGVELLISINASPFERNKFQTRLERAQEAVSIMDAPLIYVNMVGGQDELVFDGQSFALSIDGETHCHMEAFKADYRSITLSYSKGCWQFGNPTSRSEVHEPALTYNALVCGLHDYVMKNNFSSVLLGLSGGIDSALCAAIAVDALGKDHVHCVMLPSPYTSQESLDDAKTLAKNLGCRYDILDIDPIFQQTLQQLNPFFKDSPTDLTEENLQSRIRGLILMALSNKFGSMLITTGNKSEVATGYATLYGDMCGGFALIKDLYKTEVYELAHWRNLERILIPSNILTRAPSAELRPDQTDQDSLPPYDILDKILYGLIESDLSSEQLIRAGFPKEHVLLAAKLLQRSEYKRFQSSPGVKISSKAFGRDWRYPLTNHFKF